MRDTLLEWLPADLSGCRVLDAGCGTGALAVAAAARGAEVIAIDLSPTLVALANERLPQVEGRGRVDFRVGDMLDPGLGVFDYVVGMDSLIHYKLDDMLGVLNGIAERTREAILFTFAPRTPALAMMHAVGQLFPRGNRSPAIEPVAEQRLRARLAAHTSLSGWNLARSSRVSAGFYISQAQELRRR